MGAVAFDFEFVGGGPSEDSRSVRESGGFLRCVLVLEGDL